MQHPQTALAPKIWYRLLLVAALLVCSASGHAAGWVKILRDTPADAFNDADLRMFLDTAKQVLNAQGTPQLTPWANPDTGSGGDFLVLKESQAKDGSPCKRVRFTVYAAKRSAKKATWTACKAGADWKLATAG